MSEDGARRRVAITNSFAALKRDPSRRHDDRRGFTGPSSTPGGANKLDFRAR